MTIRTQVLDWWHNHVGEPANAPTWRNMTNELNHMQRRAAIEPGDHGLAELVDKLPPRQRQALLMHVGQGKNYREIARELGVTQAIVLKDLMKAYSTLRMSGAIDER